MQAKILRTPNGHYLLHCTLTQPDGWTLPESWTHIELELDSLRILCALPDQPRPQEFMLRDARLSSWLRAKVHSGKLSVDQMVRLNDVFEGIYRVEAQDGAPPVSPIQPVREAAAEPALTTETVRPRQALAEVPKMRAIRPALPKLLPRPVRREGRATAVVAPAS